MGMRCAAHMLGHFSLVLVMAALALAVIALRAASGPFQGICLASSYSQYPSRMFGRHHPPVRSHLALSPSWV